MRLVKHLHKRLSSPWQVINWKPIVVMACFIIIGATVFNRSQAVMSPPAGGYFSTLPPGASLLSESACAIQVRRSSWEPRTENTTANNHTPVTFTLPGFTANDGGVDNRSRAYADRVTGNFKGTTDEIIQWAACKWGFNDDIARSVAVKESWWINSTGGDITYDQSRCQQGYTAPCPESFGLMQVRPPYHPGTWPNARDSTAFNVDYTLMNRRICYEGWVNWLHQYTSNYAAGDEWGCVGFWYSGRWKDSGANAYIADVQRINTEKTWRGWPDLAPPSPQNGVGDINSDGVVNNGDLAILLANYRKAGNVSQGDVNGDGQINIFDLSLMLANWTR